MDNVVRHGTIVIDVVTGKVQVNAPELATVLAAKKDHVATQEKINTATEEAVRVQRRQSESLKNVARDLREAGEGAFIMARGIALMTAGTDEDLQKMVRNIAAVQAGFDLFRGSTKLIEGLSAALGVSRVATAALMATLSPYLLALGAAASAYALLTNRTREQAKAEAELRAEQERRLEFERKLREERDKRIKSLQERVTDAQFDAKSPQEQLRDLEQEARTAASRFRRQERAAESDPESIRLQEKMLQAQLDLLDAMRELRDKQDEVSRINDGKADAVVDAIKGVGDSLGGVWGRLTGQEKQLSLLEQALRAFKN